MWFYAWLSLPCQRVDRAERRRTPGHPRFQRGNTVGGRKAVFEVTAASVRNPLHLPELRAFACPNGL